METAKQMMPEVSLNGLKVLVPRPRGEAIATTIESRGGVAIQFPVIEITEPDDLTGLDNSLQRLGDVGLIVLVSVPAVMGFVRRQRLLEMTLPKTLKVAAVGPKTAIQCESSGIHVDFVPGQRIDSEGLLDCLNGLDIEGKLVVIYRGQSGRELLKAELETLGARVIYVESYRRRTTTSTFQPVAEIWRQGEINVVLITSISILDALVALLGKQCIDLLRGTTVIALSARIAEQCTEAGIEEVLVANHASDEGMMEKLFSIVER